MTTAEPIPGEDSLAITSAGQVIEKGCESCIVTANEQGPPVSPKQKTFVVPIGKKDPDSGLHTTVPQPLPVAVGGA